MARRKNTTVFDSLHQALNGIQDTVDALENTKDACVQVITWFKTLFTKGGKTT